MGNSNQNDDDTEMTVSMVLDDGTELECVVLAQFPVAGKNYIVLLPDKLVEGFEEGDVFFYRYIDKEDDEIELIEIENEEEYEAVADAFDELLDEEEFNEAEENNSED